MRWMVVLLLLVSCTHCGQTGGTAGDLEKSNRRNDIAIEYLRKHELEAAETEVNKAIALAETNEVPFNTRGLIHVVRALDARRSKEIDQCLTGVDAEVFDQEEDAELMKAETDFARATELAPDYGEAWSNRGSVAILLELPDDAIGHLTKALGNPARLVEPGLTRTNLGYAYLLKNDTVRAAKELLTVKQFTPGSCLATLRLGRVYFAREEWDKAAQEFQSVDPKCHLQEASFYLMKTRLEQGLATEAQTARDACLAISPQSCLAAQCRASVP